MMLNLFVLD